MGSEHLQRLDVSWGHEPGRRLQSGTGFQPVSPEQAGCLCHFLRFKGSEHLRNPDVNRSHEPQLVGCGVLTAPRPGGLGTVRRVARDSKDLAKLYALNINWLRTNSSV